MYMDAMIISHLLFIKLVTVKNLNCYINKPSVRNKIVFAIVKLEKCNLGCKHMSHFTEIIHDMVPPPLSCLVKQQYNKNQITRGSCVFPFRKSAFSHLAFSINAAHECNDRKWLIGRKICQHCLHHSLNVCQYTTCVLLNCPVAIITTVLFFISVFVSAYLSFVCSYLSASAYAPWFTCQVCTYLLLLVLVPRLLALW